MTHHEHSPGAPKAAEGRKRPFLNTPVGLALCVFLTVAGVLLVFEHRVHLLGAWPLLFLLVCGGMHFFMHRGHGGHGGRSGGRDER
jgi:heme/copper-type cytochrome/quinol oxidase subunit 4